LPCGLLLDFTEWVEEGEKDFVKWESRRMILWAIWKSTIAASVSMNFPDQARLLLLIKVLILLPGRRPHNLV